ncbi:O-antigen ligase family protein [Patescibacteria group bacterium]|nr:O-antigen ligase family protein [Patescibacteria group bacterium]
MAKTRGKLSEIFASRLIFVYLLLFPLGQLIRLESEFFGTKVTIHPVDIVAGLSLLLFLLGRLKTPAIFASISSFLAVAVFSLIFSLTILDSSQVLIGSLYLLRFIAYSSFFVVTWNFAKKKSNKATLFNSLIMVSVFTAVYGWVQYFWVPDLRTLKLLGWDDHYYRLTGTFLDPGFTGMILALGFLASVNKYFDRRKLKELVIIAFLAISTVFTYSRASYLALFMGLIVIFIAMKKSVKRLFFATLVLVIIVIPLLPRDLTEGARLERTHSIFAKLDNYSQTLSIIKKHPVFGVGFNNLCWARKIYLGDEGFISHSCSGSDSSLLFVLATTGVVGLLVFLNMSLKILKSVGRNIYGKTFLAASAALFFHSLFLNSLFYPWVMGWMGLLLALSIEQRD